MIILDYKNLKFKHFVDDLTIDICFSGNFESMKDIKRKCNIMIDLSKFTSNKKHIEWSCSLKLRPFLFYLFIIIYLYICKYEIWNFIIMIVINRHLLWFLQLNINYDSFNRYLL